MGCVYSMFFIELMHFLMDHFYQKLYFFSRLQCMQIIFDKYLVRSSTMKLFFNMNSSSMCSHMYFLGKPEVTKVKFERFLFFMNKRIVFIYCTTRGKHFLTNLTFVRFFSLMNLRNVLLQKCLYRTAIIT